MFDISDWSIKRYFTCRIFERTLRWLGWRGLVEGIFPAMHGNADFRFPLASYFLDDVQRGSMSIGFSRAKREKDRKMVRTFCFFYAYILLAYLISAIFSSADFTQFTRDYSLVVNSKLIRRPRFRPRVSFLSIPYNIFQAYINIIIYFFNICSHLIIFILGMTGRINLYKPNYIIRLDIRKR